MDTRRIIYQRPYPKLVIKDPETGKIATSLKSGIKLAFSADGNTSLLSYSFTLSINDISGSFSATFFPDYKNELGETFSLFDDLKKLQIVEIYEGNGISTDKPVFTGIIRRKKYIAQAHDSGGNRRISISGTAITGLISQFYINLDVSACALSKELKTQAAIINKLTIDGKAGESVKNIVKKIWDCFYEISQQLGTPKIKEYIDRFTGGVDSLFDIDNSTFHYPLGCVFNGQTTQDFFSLIDGIVPSPVYEKFAYMGSDGKMKIKIRLVPFDNDKWATLCLKSHYIESDILQSFDLTESDDEVYTAFYAYLNGYPIDEQKSLILSTNIDNAGVDNVLKDSERFKIYGYRPMTAHFIGYGIKEGEQDSDSVSGMEQMSLNLKNWYEHLPDMLKGSIVLSLIFNNKINKIQPGEVVNFLSGYFYVEGVTHNWNYGSGGEINLSVSRGGKYLGGEFKGQIENITDIMRLVFKAADGKVSGLALNR